MKDEMKSMQDNAVWNLIELPKDVKPVACKWKFKTKRDSKGNVERYKAVKFDCGGEYYGRHDGSGEQRPELCQANLA